MDEIEEQQVALKALQTSLAELPTEIVGQVECRGDDVLVFGGQVELGVEIVRDDSLHENVVHCRVLVRRLGNSPAPFLEACVAGVGESRNEALQNAAQSWVTFVAPCIFSVLHAGPVLGAEHFHDDNEFGLVGAHGFLSPRKCVGVKSDDDVTPLLASPMFKFASEMAPSNPLHLAKVTFASTPTGWKRSLEIDDHQAVHVDESWEADGEVAGFAMVVGFAVFHRGEHFEREEEERANMDAAIQRFLELAVDVESLDGIAAAMKAEGISSRTTSEVVTFVPMTAARLVFGRLGVSFAQTFIRASQGTKQEVDLMAEPAFARGMAMASKASGKAISNAARLGPEIWSISVSLEEGTEMSDVYVYPTVIDAPLGG